MEGHRTRAATAPVEVAAKHICLLFRRFVSFGEDMTRPYVEALEARGIPHLLVGGRAFHEREEVETHRAALAAIEWPDDELSVFATLRGVAVRDRRRGAARVQHRFGALPPFGFRALGASGVADVPRAVPPHLAPIADALRLLQQLHRAATTCRSPTPSHELLDATRAHVGFVLRPAASRRWPTCCTSRSWRGSTRPAAASRSAASSRSCAARPRRAQAAEAPILEEGSDGVRLMTVHKAKGLEFPVVDPGGPDVQAGAGRSRPLDRSGARMCALKLGGWAPTDCSCTTPRKSRAIKAEGERLAYVAATRARDVLVVPVVGDEVVRGRLARSADAGRLSARVSA